MEIHLTPEQEAHLFQIAEHEGKKPEQLIVDAALGLLADGESHIHAVLFAKRLARGRCRTNFIDEEEMDARFEKLMQGLMRVRCGCRLAAERSRQRFTIIFREHHPAICARTTDAKSMLRRNTLKLTPFSGKVGRPGMTKTYGNWCLPRLPYIIYLSSERLRLIEMIYICHGARDRRQ